MDYLANAFAMLVMALIVGALLSTYLALWVSFPGTMVILHFVLVIAGANIVKVMRG